MVLTITTYGENALKGMHMHPSFIKQNLGAEGLCSQKQIYFTPPSPSHPYTYRGEEEGKVIESETMMNSRQVRGVYLHHII